MKIAFPTNNGLTIFPHFGRAETFTVITLDPNGVETSREQRAKFHHTTGHAHDEKAHHHGAMLTVITDCQVVIAGGMGQPAYSSLQQAGLVVWLTRTGDINTALTAYQNNTLENDFSLIHQHHDHHH